MYIRADKNQLDVVDMMAVAYDALVCIEQWLTTVLNHADCTINIYVQGYFRTGSFLHNIPFILPWSAGKSVCLLSGLYMLAD